MAKLRLSLLCILALSGSAFADAVASFKFKGINNNENAVIIDPSFAQDLLNVDVTPGGASFKKRSGYGTYKALATVKPMHGGYHSFDATGNDVQIWGSSTSLYGIVADATPTQLISSATLNSTWDCADSQGSAYCVDSSRDAYVKTAGATMTWYASPLGTMIETTPDRMVVAGVSGSPNTLYFSQSNVFTNYVVGINSADPFTEVIASPGSKLTHIRWGCGELLWWKDQSFGTMIFDDQFNVQIKTVSDTIGTFDNTSAIDPGGSVWFRGQDGHTYKYDCSFLTKESIDIRPNVQASGRRVSNSWTQSSQSDFSSGSVSPATTLSTTTSAGDVTVAINTVSDKTNANFNSASSVVRIDTTTLTNAFQLKYYVNDTLASLALWTTVNGTFSTASGFTQPVGSTTNNILKLTTGPNPSSDMIMSIDIQNNDVGNWMYCMVDGSTNGYCLEYALGNQIYLESCTPFGDTSVFGCRSRSTLSITNYTPGTSFHTYELSRTNATNTLSFYIDGVFKSSGVDSNYTSFTNFRIYASSGTSSPIYLKNAKVAARTGNLVSRNLDTTLYPSFWNIFTSNTNALGSITTSIKSSSDGTTYSAEQSVNSGDSITVASGRYAVYSATLTATTLTSAPIVYSASVTYVSTGTFYSAVRSAPNLTSWSTLGVNSQNNSGSHSFYVRGGGTLFSVTSSTPGWIAQTAGNLISATTGVYVQFRDDFGVTAATQTPTLNDFTLNWFEGSASDQAYMLYFDNAIWESVAFGAGQATNNYIFKRDLINDAWTLYNFGAGGMLIQANTLYFGDTSLGNVFNYGTGTSDNGTAINAYWKSKDFTGTDPFMQNQLQQIDVFAKKDQGTTLTSTYTTDTSTATAYSINLSTSASIIQNRKLIPSGKNGYTMNLKLGDSSTSSAWEVFGYRIGFTQLPYRPTQ